jgi:hypothetical protein
MKINKEQKPQWWKEADHTKIASNLEVTRFGCD